MPSMQQRGPETWRLVVCAGSDEEGHPIQRRMTFHGGRRDAERELVRFAAAVQRDRRAAQRPITLATWAAQWLQDVAGRLAPGTVHNYRQHLQDRVLPSLGKVALQDLTPADIHRALRDAERVGRLDGTAGDVSQATLLRAFRAVSSCLQEAVWRGLLETNPCRAVRPPAAKRPRARWYGPAEVARLLEAVELDAEPAMRLLVRVALATGARRGELLALEWQHVRWDGAALEIAQAVTATDHGWATKVPKSGIGRVVALDAATLADLRTWQEQRAVARLLDGDYAGERIFVRRNGEWMAPDWVSKRFAALIARHALPELTFHGLRHTAASLLLDAGIPTGATAQLLGHSSPSITANIYGHVLDGALRRASDTLGRILSPEAAPDGS